MNLDDLKKKKFRHVGPGEGRGRWFVPIMLDDRRIFLHEETNSFSYAGTPEQFRRDFEEV